MIKLLNLEFVKLKKFHALKYILLSYFIAVPGLMYFMNFIFNKMPGLKKIFTQHDTLLFPHIWSFITFSASFFNVLLAVIIVIITTNDFQYKTMRQNIIDGLSKHDVILGKFISVVILSFIATLYTFICGLVIGGLHSGTFDCYGNIHLLFLYAIQTLGYFSFAFLFAIVVKKPAIAIITFIFYFPVETIIGQIISRDIYQFFPLKVFADLTPMPFFQAVIALDEKEVGHKLFFLDTNFRIVLSLIYVLLFFLGTYFLLKRKDL